MERKKRVIQFIAFVVAAAVVLAGMSWLSCQGDKKRKKETSAEGNVPIYQEKKKAFGTVGESQEERQAEEELSGTGELLFFQEEILSFLSVRMRDEFKAEFSETAARQEEKGITCCVVLKNITALSGHTYRFYVQTNESENNLYQIIINESADMIDIEKIDYLIPEIESYGGVLPGDTIERIYVYGTGINQAPESRESVTLEEETEAKEKEYQEGKGQ